MKHLFTSFKRWLLSLGERAAIRAILAERRLASYHRCGLRQIRRHALSRPTKLNLGCGPFRKDGFLNIDLMGGDLTLDLRQGLPFEADCCELIFSEHCFEHFDYPEPISTLFRDRLRVLKPGGMLQFSVPHTAWPLTNYRDGPDAPYFKACDEHKWHLK
jgi:predicted SAM-dependent methyltransferase